MVTVLGIKLLLLLFAANSAQIIALHLLGSRGSRPVDGGKLMTGGHPIFGSSKTWRGILAALLLTGVTAWLMGFSLSFGLLFGLCSMPGDLLSSFTKRRLGKPPNTQVLMLDQLPESLLSLIIGSFMLGCCYQCRRGFYVGRAASITGIVQIGAS